MFGITIVGCFIIRLMLQNLNKKLEQGDRAWETRPDVARHTADLEHVEPDEALKLIKGFRYMV